MRGGLTTTTGDDAGVGTSVTGGVATGGLAGKGGVVWQPASTMPRHSHVIHLHMHIAFLFPKCMINKQISSY